MMRIFFLFTFSVTFFSCNSSRLQPTAEEMQKIRFDLSQLDENGLLGPENGKVALDYEFCIPQKGQYRQEVERIDPSLKIQTAKGRIGCSRDQYLCLGNTHQKNYKEVLYRLARLSYIERIERTFFE
ncbi:MAG: hypothetical protein KDD06_14025 [Phaeodactylibacter sp.]|nr:hypothetical protein [Phaeodactylibacter sp.]MCB9264110.1 hypothetical protein [Lewinellaceae bacterium]MCB9286730.1 hypothetical protein [Lewinellaceae bacterium]